MSPLAIFRDIGTFFKMANAILHGRYKMPWQTFGWAVLCFVYFISPIDLLPDLLPALGIADDGAFILFVLLRLHQDLQAFRQFQPQTKQEKPTIIIDAEVVSTQNSTKEEK